MKRLTFIPLLLLTACLGGNTAKETAAAAAEPPFFSGGFIYFADAALFTDCATAVRLPVSKAGAYIDAETAYLEFEPEMGEAIYVEFRGHIGEQPRMEGEGNERAFVIDSLIGFDRTRQCPQWVLAGVYDAPLKNGRQVLFLRPDYTFTEAVYDALTVEPTAEYTGRWWRNAALELVLAAETPAPDLSVWTIDPTGESLTRNGAKKPKTFTRSPLR